MSQDIRNLQKLLHQAMRVMPEKLPRIVESEGLKFISKNFKEQGFTDTGLKKWKKRKTKGLTRYKTNRVGTKGNLNRFGSKDKDRAILVGHNTGGDKLKNSFKGRRSKSQVRFITYKAYAQRHNEGLDDMPQRQYMGKSAYLNKQIGKKLTKELNKLFKK